MDTPNGSLKRRSTRDHGRIDGVREKRPVWPVWLSTTKDTVGDRDDFAEFDTAGLTFNMMMREAEPAGLTSQPPVGEPDGEQ